MASLRAPAASLFVTILLFASRASAEIQADFSTYPTGAQPCLYQAADQSECHGDTGTELNVCLCGNEKGGFITLAAQCLGPDSPDLAGTYSVMTTNCAGTRTPIVFSQDQWYAAAFGSTTTSTTGKTSTTSAATSVSQVTSTRIETITQSASTLTTVTTSTGQVAETTINTSSSSPTSTDSRGDGSGSGTNTALIGGVVGGVAVVLLAVIGVVFFVLRKRLNAATKGKDELHPMFNNSGSGNGGSGGVPGAGVAGMFSDNNSHVNTPLPNLNAWGQTAMSPSAVGGAGAGTYDHKGNAWTITTPPPRSSTGQEGNPNQPQAPWAQPQPYQGAGGYHQGAVELSPETAPQMYELDNSRASQWPAEIPGNMMPPQHS